MVDVGRQCVKKEHRKQDVGTLNKEKLADSMQCAGSPFLPRGPNSSGWRNLPELEFIKEVTEQWCVAQCVRCRSSVGSTQNISFRNGGS